jgi:hypothetical protein
MLTLTSVSTHISVVLVELQETARVLRLALGNCAQTLNFDI